MGNFISKESHSEFNVDNDSSISLEQKLGNACTQYRARICKCIWSPGTNSEESISPASVVWRAGTTNRVVVPARQARESIPGLLQRFTNTASVSKGNKEEEFLLSSFFGPRYSPLSCQLRQQHRLPPTFSLCG
jgi:hypothetical protein